jgi:uncharacterized protein
MLKVDLGRLAQRQRERIEVEIPAGDALWSGTGLSFVEGVEVDLDVQLAGADVVVRGGIRGAVELACRRCTTPVTHELDEDVTLVYRAGIGPAEAEAEEVYALPPRGHELDLGPAVLELLLLAVPEFVCCDEACRGLCPRCGANLNQASCECVVEEEDPRWAALRRLRSE